jgi:hypothetical protein
MTHKLQEFEQQCLTFEQLNILNNLISLWQRYVIWTRALFLSKLENSTNLDAVQNRVDQLPMDFYNVLRVFYGERLAEQFLISFQLYVRAHSSLMNAMIANDQEAVNTAAQELYARADEIAAFLSQAPYWSMQQWQSLLYRDISLSISEFRAALTGEYENEISIFERLLLNATEIGGYMARGIFQSTQAPPAIP